MKISRYVFLYNFLFYRCFPSSRLVKNFAFPILALITLIHISLNYIKTVLMKGFKGTTL